MLGRGVTLLVCCALLAQPFPVRQSASAIPTEPTVLEHLIERIESLDSSFGRIGVRAVTIIRLDTRERVSLDGATVIKAASAAKPLWVAAALARHPVEALDAVARRALWASSNQAAGRILDAAGGVDAVNDFARGAGLADTMVYAWSYDRRRVSRDFPGPLRGINTTTTDDLARLWELVLDGSIAGGDAGPALMEWTRGFKEESDGDALMRRLPAPIGARASFKVGWLRGGIAGLVEIGAGVVSVPGGPSYVVAIGVNDGATWGAMASWFEYVSCVVYSVVAGDPVDCVRGWDPVAVRERRAVPDGELGSVVVRPGFVGVSGWAADPDAWWRPTRVAVSLDGVVVALAWAVPTGGGDLFAPGFYREFPFEGGVHEVCVVALNDGNGADTPIGCQTVTL